MNNREILKVRKLITKELMRFKLGYRLQSIIKFFNIGAVLTIFSLLIAYFYKVWFNIFSLPVWVFLLPLLFFILLAALKPIRAADIASKVDHELNLKERFSTSLYYVESKEIYAVQLFKDTLSLTKGVRVFSIFPMQLSRAAILIFLLASIVLFYNIQAVESSKSNQYPQYVKLIMQEEGVKIKYLADKLKNDSSFKEDWENVLVQKLAETGEQLHSELNDKRDALILLNNLSSLVENNVVKKRVEDSATKRESIEAVEHSMPLITEHELDENSNIHEILDTIKLAKRHIAESAIKTKLLPDESNGNYQFGSVAKKKSSIVKGKGGSLSIPTEHSALTKSGMTGGGASTTSEKRADSFTTKPIRQGNFRTYATSVLPIETVPERYHLVIKRYFDAISADQEIINENN